MCDEKTERDNELLISRRRMGLGVAATAVLAGCGSGEVAAAAPEAPAPVPDAPEPAPPAPELQRRRVVVPTPHGEADALFVTPKSGKHPAVILWPDVAGLREAYETMAARLAEAGYAVLAVNPYYRSAKSPILANFEEWRTDEGRAKIAPMREALTPEAIASDGVALVGWLDQQVEVDTSKRVGTQGYCMSGSFALRVAAAVPGRVGAAASFHGGGLVTDKPDSPHLLFPKLQGAVLICIAQNDHDRDQEAKPALEAAAAANKLTAQIEVYPANHGWCALDSPVYDKEQAERAWARLLATYAENL